MKSISGHFSERRFGVVQVSMKKAERLCFTLLTLGILASLSAGIHLQGKGPAGRDDVLVAKEGIETAHGSFSQ